MKPPLALKDGKPFRLVDRETKKCLLGMRQDFGPKVVLSEIPQRKAETRKAETRKAETSAGAPVASPPYLNRQQKKAFARKHVDVYLARNEKQFRHLNAKQRAHFREELVHKVLRDAPSEAFAPRSIEQVKLIVPEVQIQAEGVPVPANEQRSPGGIILP